MHMHAHDNMCMHMHMHMCMHNMCMCMHMHMCMHNMCMCMHIHMCMHNMCMWLAAAQTVVRPTPQCVSNASAVRACAVTLNKEIRVCRGGGDLVAKETVRSARSKEECVQSGPRSRHFAVKDAAFKNNERHEEAERPLSLGAAEILELLRGESRL